MFVPVESKYNLKNIERISPYLKNIKHFLFYGTLLGYKRHNNVIEGDDDIDILVEISHKHELIQLLLKLGYDISIDNKYFVQATSQIDGITTKSYASSFLKISFLSLFINTSNLLSLRINFSILLQYLPLHLSV